MLSLRSADGETVRSLPTSPDLLTDGIGAQSTEEPPRRIIGLLYTLIGETDQQSWQPVFNSWSQLLFTIRESENSLFILQVYTDQPREVEPQMTIEVPLSELELSWQSETFLSWWNPKRGLHADSLDVPNPGGAWAVGFSYPQDAVDIRNRIETVMFGVKIKKKSVGGHSLGGSDGDASVRIIKQGWINTRSIMRPSGSSFHFEISSTRKWKRYWVVLRGKGLALFSQQSHLVEGTSGTKVVINVESCICTSQEEEAPSSRTSNLIAITTFDGFMYLFQLESLEEAQEWMRVILRASAEHESSGTEALAYFTWVCKNIETLIQFQSVKSDSSGPATLWRLEDVQSYEQRLLELYRARCIIAVLEDTAFPESISVLGNISAMTMTNLSKLTTVTVATLYAYYASARSNNSANPMAQTYTIKKSNSLLWSQLSRGGSFSSLLSGELSETSSISSCGSTKSTIQAPRLRVVMADGNTVVAPEPGWKVQDVLEKVCQHRKINSEEHFIAISFSSQGLNDIVPCPDTLVEILDGGMFYLHPKSVATFELKADPEFKSDPFGITLTHEQGCKVVVSAVENFSPAMHSGIQVGDQLLEINGTPLHSSSMTDYELQNCLAGYTDVQLKMKVCRVEGDSQGPDAGGGQMDYYLCPPPSGPRVEELTLEALEHLLIPPPDTGSYKFTFPVVDQVSDNGNYDDAAVELLLKAVDSVTVSARLITDVVNLESRQAPMSSAQRLAKLIQELYDTEKSYAKDVEVLFYRYLIPMKEERFLSLNDGSFILGCISELNTFVIYLLNSFGSIIKGCHINQLKDVSLFKDPVIFLSEVFLENLDRFCLYSTYCSCYTKLTKLIRGGNDPLLKSFLDARNPTQQHSGHLESILIKPIQRIMRYPLLLREIQKILRKDKLEIESLTEAISSIEGVANSINSMQKVQETFLPLLWDHCAQNIDFKSSDLSTSDLLHFGDVTWCNPSQAQKKLAVPSKKKETAQEVLCFVFKKALFLVSDANKTKKKPGGKSGESAEVLLDQDLNKVTFKDFAWDDEENKLRWELVLSTSGFKESETKPAETCLKFLSRTLNEKKAFLDAVREAKRGTVQPGLFP